LGTADKNSKSRRKISIKTILLNTVFQNPSFEYGTILFPS
jgi:hypothetical protein